MTVTKKLTQADWYNTYSLTSEQRKKLLDEKIERARRYQEAHKQREAFIKGR